MSIELTLYLIDFFGNLGGLCGGLVISSGIVYVIFAFFASINHFSEGRDYDKTFLCKLNKLAKSMLGWWLLMAFITCAIPSQKTMYMMISASVLKSSTIPTKVEQAIEKKLDEYLQDGKKS